MPTGPLEENGMSEDGSWIRNNTLEMDSLVWIRVKTTEVQYFASDRNLSHQLLSTIPSVADSAGTKLQELKNEV